MKIQVYTPLDYVFVGKPFTISIGLLDSDTMHIVDKYVSIRVGYVCWFWFLFNAYLWILITSPEVNFHVDICYTDENGTAISPPLPNQIFVFFLLLGVDRLMILKIRRTRCAVIRTESHESPIFK